MSYRRVEEEGLDDDEEAGLEEEEEPEEVEEEAEEEEEEEEEEESRKKKRQKKEISFMMTEAEESDDEAAEDDDDEGEIEGEDQGFLDDREDLRSQRIGEHQSIQRNFRESSNQDLQEQAKYLESRYAHAYDEDISHRDFDAQKMTPAALQPKETDPRLWIIKCKIGSSRRLAMALMRKFIDTLQTEPLEIYSVVTCDHVKEYVYVEAHKKAHIEKAIENLNGFSRTSLKLIPLNEMVDVLSVRKKEIHKVQLGAWVRLKRGVYNGDLGQVIELEDEKGIALVKCVPRIDPDSTTSEERRESKKAATAEKRKRSSFRPPAQLLTRILEDHPDLKRFETKSKYIGFTEFRHEKFKDGFLYKEWHMNALESEGVTPTLDELQIFQGNEGGPVSDLKSLLGSLGESQIEATAASFKKGDDVEVIEGESSGLIGIVDKVEGNVVTVAAKKDGMREMKFKFSPSEIRKYFEEGDYVKVNQGRFQGETGMIVKIDKSVITIISDTTKEEMQIFSKDIEKATDKSSGAISLGNFFLHDFVNIDQSTVGVVIRVERETLKVLDQNGVVRNLRVPEILQKRNSKNAVSLDRNRNNIKVDDAVTILDGPQKGKQAKIMHLFRSTAFLQSNEVTENMGIIAIPTNNIMLVGGEKMRKPQDNPHSTFAVPAPRQANPNVRRKDPLLYKTVSVVLGPFKGYQGKIIDVNENTVRIELHSRPKPISVTKDMIKIKDVSQQQRSSSFEGSRTPAYGGQTPAYSGSRTPSYPGSQTPMYGSRTPAYDGGMTPSYDSGSRTPAWDAGSRTPSYGSSWGSGGESTSQSYTPVTPGHIPATPQGETPYSDMPTTPRGGEYYSDNPATPHEGNPETPSYGTPYGQPEGSHHYSSSGSIPQTPGNIPSTPGSHVPQTPAYGTPGRTPGTPSTPGGYPQTPFSDNRAEEEDWVVPRLQVKDNSTGRKGVVEQVRGDVCSLLFEGDSSPVQVQVKHLSPVIPEKGDELYIIHGDHKGESGKVLNIYGKDGIVQTPDWKILPVENLCRYIRN